MANRITSWCIDCGDADGLAHFWSEVLGWVVIDRDEEGVSIKSSLEAAWGIDFLRVPDGPKQVKNRVHLDLNAIDRDQAAELERLLGLGATLVDIGQGEVTWHVLADPEGNEFCLLRRRVEPEATESPYLGAADGAMQ